MNARRSLAALAVVAALLIGAGVYWRVHRRAGSASPTGAPQRAKGMPAMPGMALTPGQLRQFGVTFGIAEQRTLTNEVRTVGTVTADETKIVSVTPKIGGYVERLYVNSTGQSVHRGEPLAEVYSPDLLAAEQEMLLARQLDSTVPASAVPGVPSPSGGLLEASKRKLRLLDVSEAQIDEMLRTGQPRRTVTLYAPTSGIVTDKKVVQGQAIQPGVELYTITDLSDVWIDGELREADAGLVSVDTPAQLEFTSFPGRTYQGRVAYVYPVVSEPSRSVRARIVVGNADGRLKPGMYATVRLRAPARSALTIPRSAVVQTGQRTLVFVDAGAGRLAPRNVVIGRVAGEYAEVLSGVQSGERVVTSAQFLLDSESNLGEVMKSMIGMGAK